MYTYIVLIAVEFNLHIYTYVAIVSTRNPAAESVLIKPLHNNSITILIKTDQLIYCTIS